MRPTAQQHSEARARRAGRSRPMARGRGWPAASVPAWSSVRLTTEVIGPVGRTAWARMNSRVPARHLFAEAKFSDLSAPQDACHYWRACSPPPAARRLDRADGLDGLPCRLLSFLPQTPRTLSIATQLCCTSSSTLNGFSVTPASRLFLRRSSG